MGAGVVKNDEKTAIKDSGMREILKKATKDYRGWAPLGYGIANGVSGYVGGLAVGSFDGLIRYIATDLPKIPQYVMEHPDILFLLEKSFERLYSAFSRVNAFAQIGALSGLVGGVIIVGRTKRFVRKGVGGE